MLISLYYCYKKLSNIFPVNILLVQSYNSNTKIGCERCSRFFKKTLEIRKSIILVPLLTSLNQLYILFQCFNCRFLQVKIPCSNDIFSKPTSSRNHNVVDSTIAMNSYQSSSEDLKFSVLENNSVQKVLTRKFI